MFRILVVDDDPASATLLREVMKDLHRASELHFAWDGAEALDFLYRRGAYVNAPRPNLILLDMNMPRVSGLETLSVIKADPELRLIPVIMLSASNSPQDVRRSYQAHANCYVQKPSDLNRSVKLLQAVEAFWMDFALMPVHEQTLESTRQAHESKGLRPSVPDSSHSGRGIAPTRWEAKSRAMQNANTPMSQTPGSIQGRGCEEHNRLLEGFGVAVRELLDLHEQQFKAIVDGDVECSRFDLLIHMGNEKKQLAKYAYLRHVESHGCSNFKWR